MPLQNMKQDEFNTKIIMVPFLSKGLSYLYIENLNKEISTTNSLQTPLSKKHPKNLSWLSFHVQHHAVVVMTPNLAAPGKDSGETVDSRGIFSNFVWCPHHVGSGLALCLWGAAPKNSRVPGAGLVARMASPQKKEDVFLTSRHSPNVLVHQKL